MHHIIFDHSGAIEFSSPFEVTLPTFIELFATNSWRRVLANNLTDFANNLEKHGVAIVRIFIGGSFVTTKPEPDDLDILICWRPQRNMKNKQEVETYLKNHALLFGKNNILKTYKIQVHFHGLLGSPDSAINLVAKWTLLNSYSRDAKRHRGIISLSGNALKT